MDTVHLPTQKDLSGVADVMALVGKSKANAYKIIHRLNAELQAQGYLTIPGRVPTKYLRKRLGI